MATRVELCSDFAPRMGNLNWQSYPDTGFHAIDVEHRSISGRLTRLLEAVTPGDAGVAAGALAPLIREIVEHFAHEERFMVESGYPAEARHRAAHAAFVARLRPFAEELAAKGLTPGFVRWVTAQLPEALHAHIMGHDVELGLYLSARAARAGGGEA